MEVGAIVTSIAGVYQALRSDCTSSPPIAYPSYFVGRGAHTRSVPQSLVWWCLTAAAVSPMTIKGSLGVRPSSVDGRVTAVGNPRFGSVYHVRFSLITLALDLPLNEAVIATI